MSEKKGKLIGMAVGFVVVTTLLICAAVYEDFNLNVWRISGTQVTSTATELNQLDADTATGISTVTVISNVALDVSANDVTASGNLVVSSNATVSGTISGVPSAGTGVVATATAVESYGTVNKTVLTLADTAISVTDLLGTTNSSGGTKIYVFPEGEIYVLGFAINDFTFATNAVIDNNHGGDFAFGTTVGTGSDLSTTEMDLTDAKVSIDPITNITDAVTEFDDIGESRFDGTATKKEVFVNVLLDGADIDANTTNTVDATVTIHWVNLGDD